jgi:hypothetical protein
MTEWQLSGLSSSTVETEAVALRFERTPAVLACLLFSLIGYADIFSLLSSPGPVGTIAKTAYLAILAIAFLVVWFSSGTLWRHPVPAWIFLLFMVWSTIAYVTQIAMGAVPNSYVTAFAPTLLFSLVLVMPRGRNLYDERTLLGTLTNWFFVLSAMYLGELLVRQYLLGHDLGNIETLENHVKSVAFVAGAVFAIFSKRPMTFALIVAMAAASLIIRPSSTVLIALAVCCAIALAIVFGRRRFALVLSLATLAVLAAAPFAIRYVPEVRDLLLQVESLLKEGILEGNSNTAVRLAIQDAAFARFESGSWLFGDFFGSAVNVYVGDTLPWWFQNSEEGLATIHSDYVIILLESGIVGYALFNTALFLLVLGTHDRGGSPQRSVLSQCIAPLAVGLAIYSSYNPFLQYYQVTHAIWFSLFLLYYLPQNNRSAQRRTVPPAIRPAAFETATLTNGH